MTVKEFSKYVIDNLNRASLVNAFNIAEKLDNPNYYSLEDFVHECVLYLTDSLVSVKLKPTIACKLLSALFNCEKAINSEYKFNR
jgi:hypothetical protein